MMENQCRWVSLRDTLVFDNLLFLCNDNIFNVK
jgi:hypothetical protein